MTNRLAEETSPYLLQHAENPVDWYSWGPEALSLAKALDKPILLSIGYSACHWCHVMAHESFEDAEIAALMNAHFINIKVDREERPDIDQIYQTAHGMLSQRSGGWPLTVFLTPDQQPYFTGTYFPKTPRYQLPGFADLIPRVARFYHERKAEIQQQNAQLMTAFARMIPVSGGKIEADANVFKTAFSSLEANFDFKYGGFGTAPKFPNPADITFLLHQAKTDNAGAKAMGLQMLHAMADGGIYDHLGGGFCRYSVDERWNIPHFEKMLYDNGQLLALYADAYRLAKDAKFAHIIEETVGWLQREMTSPEGAFYSSQDADSLDANGHSEEGAFYIWQPSEVKSLLDEREFATINRVYGLDRAANFEGHAWHFYIAVPPEESERIILDQARAKLFAARGKRNKPGRDDKVLTSWNALAIKGLACAGRALDQHEYIILAQAAMDFIRRTMWQNGQLLATYKGGKAHLNAYLDDYAFVLDALLELLQADYREVDLIFATEIANALIGNFESDEGGFFFTSHHHETLIHRPRQPYDNATPSGNGIAAVALQRLGHVLGESRYLAAAERTLTAFDRHIQHNPAACVSLCHALHEYLDPPKVIIVRGETAQMHVWRKGIDACFSPHSLCFYLHEHLTELPETLDKNFSKDVNAWICQGVSCLPRVVDLELVLSEL